MSTKEKAPASLRCKPGDIAVVLGRMNLGRLVQVERLHTNPKEVIDGELWLDVPGECNPAWVVHSLSGPLHARRIDGVTPDPVLHMTSVINDAILRPLRDSDAPDESLMWKPTPRKRKAKITNIQSQGAAA
jgi:hypothetical protein